MMNSQYSFTSRLSRREALLAFGAAALPVILARTGLAADAPASPAADAPPELKTEALGEKFAVVSGAGGNIAVLGGEDGALVIDSGLAAVSAGSASEIAKAAQSPLALLVNTHWHFDHVGGNERLAKEGARIIGSENCRKRMSAEQHIEFFDKTIPASSAAALPLLTFTSETSLHLNGEDIRLIPVPPAHTDGDIFVRFEKANVVHCGDIFFRGLYPFIDYSTGGWIGGMAEATKRVLALTDAKTRIIPGHGPLGTQADLKEYLTFLETVLERFDKLKAEGRNIDEIVASAPTKEFDESRTKGLFKPEQFVRFAYAGLLKHG